jgi:streptogramin lyase
MQMQETGLVIAAIAVATVGVMQPHYAEAQSGTVALTGTVSSAAEGVMEGVLVTLRGDGANHTVTVVSDAGGQYSFPRSHVEPGAYSVAIRATGYDLAGSDSVSVGSGSTASLDLTLAETEDLASQLTSLEWALSFPGTEEEKDKLVYQAKSCNYCHDYSRIVKSTHGAELFEDVIRRMNAYYPDGTAVSNDGRGWGQRLLDYGDSFGKMTPDGPMEGFGDRWGGWQIPELAAYLEKVNLSGGKTTWSYEPRASLPRPTGKGTRVIITQWDQPRRVAVSHDSSVDPEGNLWYGDESHQFVGKLDPKTHEFTEFPLPELPARHLPGTRDIQADNYGNVWFPMRVEGGASVLTRLDPETGELTLVEGTTGQFTGLGPGDTIWMGGAGNEFTRISLETATLTGTYPGRGYQVVVNSAGNPYIGGGGGIVGYDVAAEQELQYQLPTERGFARRGKMDDQDRFWFGEYYGDKIGVFDTRSETFQEWPLRKYSTPYAASAPDKDGWVWAPSNMSDRMFRLNPETGEIIEYLMPSEIDVKEIEFDPTSDGVAALMSNMRAARIIRIEPLD